MLSFLVKINSNNQPVPGTYQAGHQVKDWSNFLFYLYILSMMMQKCTSTIKEQVKEEKKYNQRTSQRHLPHAEVSHRTIEYGPTIVSWYLVRVCRYQVP